MNTGNDIGFDLVATSSTYRDLQFVNNDLVLISGTTAILQNILETLGVFLGEWFLDTSIGIDYFNQILVKNPDQATINAIFINQILSVAGVVQLNSYSFTPNFITRQLSIKFSVQTTQGIVNYAGLI